jgi:hypothetical protein
MLGRTKLLAFGCTALVVVGGVGVGGARVGSAGGRRAGEQAATREAQARAALEARLALLEKAQGGIAADRERLTGLGKQLDIMRNVVEAGSSTVTVLGHADLDGALEGVKVTFRISVRRAAAGDAVARVGSQAAAIGRAVRSAGATDIHSELNHGYADRDWTGRVLAFVVQGHVEATVRPARVDRVVAAGMKGRGGEVESVSFGFDAMKDAGALRQARAAAIADAKAGAVEYAVIAGKKIGVILSVTEVAGPGVESVLLQPGASGGYREEHEMLVAVTYALV